MLPMAVVSSSISSRPRLGSVATGDARSPREMSSALRLSDRSRVTRASTAGSRSARTSVTPPATSACITQLALRTRCSVPTSTVARRKCETRILLCSGERHRRTPVFQRRRQPSHRRGPPGSPGAGKLVQHGTANRSVASRRGHQCHAERDSGVGRPGFHIPGMRTSCGEHPCPHDSGEPSLEECSVFLDPAGKLLDALRHAGAWTPAQGLGGAGDVGDEDRLVPRAPVGESRAERTTGEPVQLLDQLEQRQRVAPGRRPRLKTRPLARSMRSTAAS